MTPEKFARCFIGLHIPLTDDEWYGLSNLLEQIIPGITDCLSTETRKEQTVKYDN